MTKDANAKDVVDRLLEYSSDWVPGVLMHEAAAEIKKLRGEWVDHDGGPSPVDGEQRVTVEWRDEDGSTTHRAGALNWSMVARYRLLPNPEHSR